MFSLVFLRYENLGACLIFITLMKSITINNIGSKIIYPILSSIFLRRGSFFDNFNTPTNEIRLPNMEYMLPQLLSLGIIVIEVITINIPNMIKIIPI